MGSRKCVLYIPSRLSCLLVVVVDLATLQRHHLPLGTWLATPLGGEKRREGGREGGREEGCD